ncbi:COQ9 family protein [Ferrovibrio sp.]|uniref:COQ9 family protein n=1 Tax=Ferrovibrio sp. TaxID=1917215 RepID=UPI003D129449
MSEHLETEKRALLEAMLPNVAFDGWTMTALKAGADSIGMDTGLVSRAFPGGALEALDFWVRETDRAMIAAFEAQGGTALKIRERVALAVMLRFELAAPHREAVRRAMTLAAQPHLAPRFLAQLYRTVDAIWYAAGDKATDFNFYTKRALLAGVYSATMLVWLDDKSEDFSVTRAFLLRRIDNVMQIQKARGKLETLAERLPNPLRLFRRA